jgi:hypothetical protein
MEKQHLKEAHKKSGASNVEYDLYSEVQALLKGNAALAQYIEDAREAGEREVESCFKSLIDQNKEHVVKLRELITKHLKAAA